MVVMLGMGDDAPHCAYVALFAFHHRPEPSRGGREVMSFLSTMWEIAKGDCIP